VANATHLGPDVLVRAGERSSPWVCRRKKGKTLPGFARRAGEDTRPYVVRGELDILKS